MIEYPTRKEAEERQALRLSTQAPNTPPRLWPVVVHGPTGGFCVVTQAFAAANELPVIDRRQRHADASA